MIIEVYNGIPNDLQYIIKMKKMEEKPWLQTQLLQILQILPLLNM